MLVVKSEDDQLIAMLTGQIDFLPDLTNPKHIGRLDYYDHLITATPGFHVCFVGFNLKRPYLDDVNLRHALIHAYDQQAIIAEIHRFTAVPVQSLVPLSQGYWHNPSLQGHPFNPGDSTDAPGTHSTFGIMQSAGYTYHGTGYGDPSGWWEKDGSSLPTWKLFTPTYEVARASALHGKRIVEEWHRCGFNNIIHVPEDFNDYTSWVFDDHNFDMFMMDRRLGRLPLQLYSLCHSSEYVPGSDHAVGLNDPILDGYLETLKYSTDFNAILAAWWAQDRLNVPEVNDQALPYMLLHSRVYFTAAAKDLTGVVHMSGYGSDNAWTEGNWRWNTPDGMRPGTGDSLVVYCIGDERANLNYLALSTDHEANIVEPTQDSGIRVNPYTLGDVAWQLQSVPVPEGPMTTTTPGGLYIENGMKVRYTIRDDIYWQDGNKFEANDAKFSLDFLRDNQIPQYITTWQDIEEVHVVDAFTFDVYANVTSLFLMYYWDRAAFLCPPQVWGHLDGAPLADILAYDIEHNTTDTGPWSYPASSMGPRTQVFGTGPYVFEEYNDALMYSDLHNWDADGANLGYFLSTTEFHGVKADLFWACGDVSRDGGIWAEDLAHWGLSYALREGYPGYNADADLNQDGIVDASDGAIIGSNFGKRMELGQ